MVRQITEITFECDHNVGSLIPGNTEDTIDDIIAWLNERKEEIPEEFRDKAKLTLDIDSLHDRNIITSTIYYVREETNEEFEARVEAAIEAAKRAEATERATYEMLKAKFEGK